MNGKIAVRGMALAKAYPVVEQRVDTSLRLVDDTAAELQRLQIASERCSSSLAAMIEQISQKNGAEDAGILDFQLLLLEDDNYMGAIKRLIAEEKANCEYAVSVCSEQYRSELSSLDNAYLNERTADITDIEMRLLRCLTNQEERKADNGEKIVVAVDLTPSQVIELGRSGLSGIILEKGGLSSHCVILARSMNIPCIIGAEGALSMAKEGQTVLLDAINCALIVQPDDAQLQMYKDFTNRAEQENATLEAFRHCETVTEDGRRMKVYANIASEHETDALIAQGGEGVGLLRTEMLYMGRSEAPDEDLQFAAYSAIVKDLGGRPLIVRTLDVGGDKHIPYLNIQDEDNPFLGYRAIRYCLDAPEIFHTQIAAILRAAAFGPVQLMLPMIADVSEIRRAKEAVCTVWESLERRGVKVGNVSIGMMVETPAAAVMADRFSEIVDFFSIGTNDLTQYLFAADRNNAHVAQLNSYFQPALLRMVDHICRAAHHSNIEVDICGQAGEVDELIPLWVGMGVDNLSVSIPSIPRVRRTIKNCDTEKCRALVERAISMNCEEEVLSLLRKGVEK